MIRPTPSIPSALDEHGYSLIELLVAMLSATIVAGVLFAVLSFSTTETSTLADKVQADQLGRIAMTRIVDELHSACLAPSYTPIQEKSSATELRFISSYSNEAIIPSAELHEIVWSSTNGTLTDYATKSSGTWPNFTFPSVHTTATTTTTTIAKNISEIESTEKGVKVPIFQYYSYANESTEGENSAVTTLNTGRLEGAAPTSTTGLSLTEAEQAASVLITFNQAPTDGTTKLNRGITLSNQTTLAFSVPNSENPILDAPCQ